MEFEAPASMWMSLPIHT